MTTTYTCAIPVTTAGSYSASFTYAGDNNYTNPGSSNTATVIINQIAPAVSINTDSPTANLGDTFTFTATVTGATGVPAPTGTGSFSITGVSGASCTSSLPIHPTAVSGSLTQVTYSCVVVAHTAGIYVPLFSFNGDSNYSATAPASGFTTTVAKATPSVSVVETSTTVNLGGTITFSATVTGFAGAVAPSATNSTWVITGVPGVSACTTTTGPNAGSNSYSSTYTCSVTASLAGTYGANFTFPGDSSYNPAATASSTTTQQVLPATPSVVITSN